MLAPSSSDGNKAPFSAKAKSSDCPRAFLSPQRPFAFVGSPFVSGKTANPAVSQIVRTGQQRHDSFVYIRVYSRGTVCCRRLCRTPSKRKQVPAFSYRSFWASCTSFRIFVFFGAIFAYFLPCAPFSEAGWDTYPTPEEKAAHRGDSGFYCFMGVVGLIWWKLWKRSGFS